MPLDETPYTPDWWLLRLGRKLKKRRDTLDKWDAYYSGDAPLPVPPKGVRDQFKRFQEIARSNFCEIVVGSTVNRLAAIGITDDQGEPDTAAWSWWRRNKLAARQKQVYRLSLRQSIAYVSVGEHPRIERQPMVLPEHPHNVITERDPETRELAGGLKAWVDDVTGYGRAVVSLPEVVHRYRTVARVGQRDLPWGTESWEPYGTEERPAEQENPYGTVLVQPFTRLPEIGREPVAEHAMVIDIQDRINLGVLNRLSAERYSAWRQKYVTGHKFEKKRNPATGQPLVDPVTGLEMVVNPFVPGPDTVWASEGDAVRFGEFSQTEITGFLRAHEADILDLLTISHTPATTYMSQLVNIATDTVALLDSNHVAKVAEHAANFSDSWEGILRLCALVSREEDPDAPRELRWEDPRNLNPAVVADMAVKKRSMGYPLGVLAEDMGESPERIRRITSQAAGDRLLANALTGRGNGRSEQLALPVNGE